jgi:CheY-like chemotaxis protein
MACCLHDGGCVLSRVLHVEDDLALRALVGLACENFGFRGMTVGASTVAEAAQRLDAAAHAAEPFDLIISDMHLPDGSGLDVVRYARSSATWSITPVLILSGDVDPKNVRQAYSLGANAYVDKSPAGRSLSEVLRSLYQHWGKDTVIPPPHEVTRVHRFVATSLGLRTRYAHVYRALAEKIADSPSESAFWLSRALAESNLANLFAFLRERVEDRDLPEFDFQAIERWQADVSDKLTALERALERGTLTREDAYHYVLDLLPNDHLDALARATSRLFPMWPIAMEAVRDFFIGTIQDVTAWIDLHTDNKALRERTSALRAEVAELMQQTTPGATHVSS